jgi:hypothetical protein
MLSRRFPRATLFNADAAQFGSLDIGGSVGAVVRGCRFCQGQRTRSRRLCRAPSSISCPTDRSTSSLTGCGARSLRKLSQPAQAGGQGTSSTCCSTSHPLLSIGYPESRCRCALQSRHPAKAVIRRNVDDRLTSDFGSLCQEQRVLHVDAKIAHCVLDLGVTTQDLDGSDVPRRPVNHRRHCTPKRVGAVFLWTQTDRRHPFIDQACLLPRAHVLRLIDPARKRVVLDRAASSFEPCQQALTS